MKPRSCVVIINYRNAEDTAACVASALRSEQPVRVVVVDNSPHDPALEAALAPFPNITTLHPDENLGFGRGCNLGIEWALKNTDCEFVMLLNSDATVEADTILTLEEVMDEHPNVGLATGRIVFMEAPDRLCYARGTIDWKRGGGKVPGFGGDAMSATALLSGPVQFASGCAMLLRRSLLEQIGGFDEAFHMYEEDVDLSLRVREAGSLVWYVAEALIRHKGHGSQRGAGDGFHTRWSASNPRYDFQVYHSVRNTLINARKHARGKNLVVFSTFYPLFVLRRSLPVAFARGTRAFIPVFRGFRDGLRAPLGRS